MLSSARSDVAFIQSLAATLGMSELPPAAIGTDATPEVIPEVAEDEVATPPTLEQVVGRTNAAMLKEFHSRKLDTVQAVIDAVAGGFDLTDVDGIGPKKATQIKELIGL